MRDLFGRAIENYFAERGRTRPVTGGDVQSFESFLARDPPHAAPDYEDELAIVPAGVVGGTARWLVCSLDEARLVDPPRRESIDGEFGLVDRNALVDVGRKR